MTRGLSVIDAPQIPGAASLTMPQGGELHLWFWGEGDGPIPRGRNGEQSGMSKGPWQSSIPMSRGDTSD